ncbi:hypothetical protein G9A89_012279 [Geosiphon pyriformis]|nr:hypothetical protein G9A89_012279 [Geosiphon pyriformis]
MVEKSSQEKLQVTRKLFSKVNGFGKVSTPSKFAGIIRATFTSKLSLVQASKKAEETKILVNTDLKKFSGHSDWAVVLKKIPVNTSLEAVCAVLSKFGVIKSIRMQLSDQIDLVTARWSILIEKDTDFIGSVSEKTCAIDHHSVIYAQTRCAIVCFDSAKSLDVIMETTPVLRSVTLHWSYLDYSKCAKYEKIGYMLLGCSVDGIFSFEKAFCKALSDVDKSRLASIYAKYLALIVCSVAFGDVSWAKSLVTPSSQNKGANIVMSESSGVVTGGETIVRVVIFDLSVVKKMEETLNNLLITVMGLLAKIDNTGLVPAIMNKFDGVHVFTSGIDLGYLNSGVTVIMDTFLAHHVCKVFELFVSILGLYAGASSVVWFSQAGDINSLIVKAVNESFFIILGSDFNKDNSCNNFRSVTQTIDYVFVSLNFINTLVDHNVAGVVDYFNTNYVVVSVSSADNNKWKNFKNAMLANAEMLFDKFTATVKFLDLDAIVFTKDSSRFYKLELLVLKLVKAFYEESVGSLNSAKASIIQNLVDSSVNSSHVQFALSGIRKLYCAFKLAEFLAAKEAHIRTAIKKRMGNFEINKGHIIRSVLEHPFHKVVLDHLIVNNKLILEPDLVKSKMDIIIEGWTRKHGVIADKHCNKLILDMLLVLLNFCLSCESEGVFTNTCSIALIETAHKIFSKILSDKISLAYSAFNVFHGDNFLVLKGITTQSSIFTSSGWFCRTCEKHTIQSAKNILRKAWSELRYGEIFFFLLWHIFYDLLLCKVKCQESVYEYRLNSHFISKFGSSLTATQHILNINNISINNDKTVAIPINSRISNSSLSISGLSISIVKKDVYFFTNLVLRKAVSDKQLLYLVLAVFHPIISYRTQFSFIPSESKIAFFVSFTNFGDVLGHLFSYRFHDLQVLCWHSVHLLSSPVRICVNASDNFLVGMVKVFLDCNLSLEGSLANFFQFCSRVLMSVVLGELRFFRFLLFLWRHGIAFVDQLCDHHGAIFDWYTFKCWKRLDLCSPVPEWFKLFVVFLSDLDFSSTCSLVLGDVGFLNILKSSDFKSVCIHLLKAGTSNLSMYTDGSLCNLGTASCRAGTAVFFENINLGLDIGVLDLMSSTLVELQAIALALECVLMSSSVHLFLDSQSTLDACRSELDLYWIKYHHIVNIIHNKNLRVSWHKVKNYSGISGNEHTDAIAGATSFAEVGSGSKFLASDLISEVDWLCSSSVFISRPSVNVHTYFIKALHYQLPVVISGFSYSSLDILQLLSFCISDSLVFVVFYKSFVFSGWFHKTVSIFHDFKVTGLEIVKFVHSFDLAFREDIWLVHARHQAYMEKNGLIPLDGLDLVPVYDLVSRFSAGIVKLLGVTEAFGIQFGFCKSCLFFLSVSNQISVHIVA